LLLPAAHGARRDPDLFLIARTDAIASDGLDEALRRAELYIESRADGVFIEGPKSVELPEQIGRHFKGVPKIANMLEGGGVTPILAPADLLAMGFAMVLCPTSMIFRLTRTIEKVLADMLAGRLKIQGQGVTFEEFEEIVGLPDWKAIGDEYGKG